MLPTSKPTQPSRLFCLHVDYYVDVNLIDFFEGISLYFVLLKKTSITLGNQLERLENSTSTTKTEQQQKNESIYLEKRLKLMISMGLSML